MDTLERSVQQGETDIWYIVKGPHGAITLDLMRNSHHWGALGLHWPTPQYEHHTSPTECEYIDGGWCYGDVTFLGASRIGTKFDQDGDLEALWRELEDWYHERIAPVTVRPLGQVVEKPYKEV